jgi:hypothetical protein
MAVCVHFDGNKTFVILCKIDANFAVFAPPLIAKLAFA